MAQFQPDIMVVDCFDQNGCDTGAVGTQRVGKNLIAYQGAIFRGDLVWYDHAYGQTQRQRLMLPRRQRDNLIKRPHRQCGLFALAAGLG